MRALDTGHATVREIGQYELEDEIYHTIAINADATPTVHSVVEWQGVLRPMVISLEGGRVQGAGRVVYLANGHDMKAYQCDAMRKLWVNSAGWLLE
jgi:type 1 glutamine amidotransferase